MKMGNKRVRFENRKLRLNFTNLKGFYHKIKILAIKFFLLNIIILTAIFTIHCANKSEEIKSANQKYCYSDPNSQNNTEEQKCEEIPTTNFLIVDPLKLYLSAEKGYKQTFNIFSDNSWEITTPKWLTASVTYGTGSKTLVLTTINENSFSNIVDSINIKTSTLLVKSITVNRDKFAFCGSGKGMNKPTEIYYKFLDAGSDSPNTYVDNYEKNRFIYVAVRGCKYKNEFQKKLSKATSANISYVKIMSGKEVIVSTISKYNDNNPQDEGVVVGGLTDRFRIYEESNLKNLIDNYESELRIIFYENNNPTVRVNLLLAQYFLNTLGKNQGVLCAILPNQYIKHSLSPISDFNSDLGFECITESEIPDIAKPKFNELIKSFNSLYNRNVKLIN